MKALSPNQVSNHPAGGHWYDGTFYISTSGQGILAKVFEEEPVDTSLIPSIEQRTPHLNRMGSR